MVEDWSIVYYTVGMVKIAQRLGIDSLEWHINANI